MPEPRHIGQFILSDGDPACRDWTRAVLTRALMVTLAFVALMTGLGIARASDEGWALAAKPGHVVLMRHSNAPGVGDPEGYRIDNCATQRNLDSKGRDQSRRVRAAAEARGFRFDVVLSSAWCRCLETARLVTGEEPVTFSGLNSFFDEPSRQARQVAEVKARVKSLGDSTRVLMVTHQVVITALTGRSTASGEMIVARRRLDGSLTPVASIMVK